MLLCLIAEEGREDDGGTDDEKDGTDQHHEFLDDTFLTEVHLDVDLQTGVDDHDGSYGIDEVEHIEHEGHHIVVHEGKGIGSPAVVHTATFGGCGHTGKRIQTE